MVSIISGASILFFKKDDSLDTIEDTNECRLTIKESYERLWDIIKIPPIRTLCCILLTCQLSIIKTSAFNLTEFSFCIS